MGPDEGGGWSTLAAGARGCEYGGPCCRVGGTPWGTKDDCGGGNLLDEFGGGGNLLEGGGG